MSRTSIRAKDPECLTPLQEFRPPAGPPAACRPFASTANRVLVPAGTGDSFIPGIDGPSLGDITKPMSFDVMYSEGRRGAQRLVDLEIPIIAAVGGPAPVHSEYALLADVVALKSATAAN